MSSSSPDRPPEPPTEEVRRRFRAQRRAGTEPEMLVRRAVWRRGLRYRVDRSPIPGLRSRPDLVFAPARVAVYIDGCFWHSCPEHGSIPKSNREWWQAKLEANRERDDRATSALEQAGWLVLRFWEHDEADAVASAIEAAVRSRR